MYLVVFLFGLCIGSFLNVCIFRIPEKQDIVKLPSHCQSCGRQLSFYELIPVVSYVIQGGRCRGCKAKISVQYPIIELLNGTIYLIIAGLYGLSLQAAILALLSSNLIVLSVIDLRTFEIPIGCNIFIFILGIMQVIIDLPHMSQYVIGFFAVSLILFAIWFISKGKAVGGGDIKLIAAAGLLLGFKKVILAFLLACIIGSVIHIIRMKVSGAGRTLAMGPYLSVGIFIAALFGDRLIEMYMRYLGF